VQQNLN